MAALAVGEQRGRAAPEVVVEVGGRRLFAGIALGLVVSGGETDLDFRDLADEPVADDLDGLLEEGVGALLRSDLEDGLPLRDLAVDGVALGVFVGEGFSQ